MAVSSSPSITEVPSLLADPQLDGSVRCRVCAHRCLVRPGRTGICGVRHNRAGTLMCSAYGQVAAVGLDPIEKKPLFHVDPGSRSFSIATAGCPFHCRFCQNWEIAQAPRLGLPFVERPMRPEEVVAEALETNARSIAYTYVEPTVFLEYALDSARLARTAGLRNLFITDGYATPEATELLTDVLDAANVDLKSFNDRFYRQLCGARLAPVLDTIVNMHEAGVWLELTTLVIPGWNDSDSDLEAIADWIVDTLGVATPWHISRFFPAHQMYDVPSTPAATLLRAAAIGRAAGLHYVYVGNAPDLGLEDTRCAGCGAQLIERSGYRARSHLLAGACPVCGRRLEGVGLE